jgi:3-oxoacyl-[acyl-carrier-protein] synthase-3
MDEAIIQRFYKYDRPVPQDIMPMSIHELETVA